MEHGIITKKEDAQPVADFARKEKIMVPHNIMSEMRVVIPPLYYWEDVHEGKSCLMTMAFQWRGMNYGKSYPIEEDNAVRISIMRQRLFNEVKETLDVLVHHGQKVLDSTGNIDPIKVNEAEAERFWMDKNWAKKVAAFNKLCKIYPITKKKAVKLKLIDSPIIV